MCPGADWRIRRTSRRDFRYHPRGVGGVDLPLREHVVMPHRQGRVAEHAHARRGARGRLRGQRVEASETGPPGPHEVGVKGEAPQAHVLVVRAEPQVRAAHRQDVEKQGDRPGRIDRPELAAAVGREQAPRAVARMVELAQQGAGPRRAGGRRCREVPQRQPQSAHGDPGRNGVRRRRDRGRGPTHAPWRRAGSQERCGSRTDQHAPRYAAMAAAVLHDDFPGIARHRS